MARFHGIQRHDNPSLIADQVNTVTQGPTPSFVRHVKIPEHRDATEIDNISRFVSQTITLNHRLLGFYTFIGKIKNRYINGVPRAVNQINTTCGVGFARSVYRWLGPCPTRLIDTRNAKGSVTLLRRIISNHGLPKKPKGIWNTCDKMCVYLV